MGRVEGTEEAPAIMQSPKHGSIFQSRRYEGEWPTRAVQVVDVYSIESFFLKKFSELEV